MRDFAALLEQQELALAHRNRRRKKPRITRRYARYVIRRPLSQPLDGE